MPEQDLSPAANGHAFGVYVHIPFCTHRCDYCSFTTFTDRSHLIEEYMVACVRQAEADGQTMPPVTSVFFGGGTPNLAPPAALAALLDELPLAEGAEVTVECNPDLVTDEQMARLAAAGVNRISLGVQSMLPHVLESLGRQHEPANVHRAVAAVRAAGIGQLNLDLIYGAAGESLDDWTDTLSQALALEPNHISAYGLTVEAGTPLADDPDRHPDDDDQAAKYLLADELLAQAGLVNYEISNWAQPGSECRHNLLYWQQGDYAALGAAAHGHRSGERWWNVRTPERYISAVASQRNPRANGEQLTEAEQRVEALQLALRTTRGVPADTVPEEVRHLVAVNHSTGNAVLTTEGRLLANEVAVRLS